MFDGYQLVRDEDERGNLSTLSKKREEEHCEGIVMERWVAGELLTLLAQKALYWSAKETLVVTDIHLGKAAAFRAGGIPVPEGSMAADLDRLGRLVEQFRPERLLCLGDLIHAKTSKTTAVIKAFAEWRRQFQALTVISLEGNHDFYAGRIPEGWGVEMVSELVERPFVWRHFPLEAGDSVVEGDVLAGHLHPAVHLRGIGRLPCFYFGERGGILPAFGSFTGTAIIQQSSPSGRIIAIAEDELVAL